MVAFATCSTRDIRRLRFSCGERSAMLRIAPHLVNPLPIVIPTYGHGRQGKAFLAAGLLVYDLLTIGRNSDIADSSRRIANTRLLSRERDLGFVSGARAAVSYRWRGVRGWPDVQHGPPGARLRQVGRKVGRGGRELCGGHGISLGRAARARCARARPIFSGDEFDIRAKLVLNAAGPWADYLLQDAAHFGRTGAGTSRATPASWSIASRTHPTRWRCPAASRDSDAVVSRAARHLFAVPWRDCTLIGVWHRLFSERPDTAQVEEAEIESWMAEMNASYPALQLTRSEVIYANCGLVPFGDGRTAPDELSFGKESRLIDHRPHGVGSLVTLIGIRYTTARGDSAQALDLLLEQMPNAPGRAPTESTPLAGGDIADFAALQAAARRDVAPEISTRTLHAWLRNYGTDYRALAELAQIPAQAASIGRQRHRHGGSDPRRAIGNGPALGRCGSEAHQSWFRFAPGRTSTHRGRAGDAAPVGLDG